jgi:hypothetical protein
MCTAIIVRPFRDGFELAQWRWLQLETGNAPDASATRDAQLR